MPQGQENQEKSGKTKKMTSQEKMGVFEKCWEKSGNLTKFEKTSDFVCLVYKIPYFLKPSNGYKLIKNPLNFRLKSD